MSEHAAQIDRHYTTTGIDSRKLGFWVLIGSESLFFGSLIATYMVYRGQSTVGPFPHGPDGLLDIPLTSVSTFVLLMSSLAMVLALHAVQVSNRRGALIWLLATALLGAGFLGFQAYEFTHFWHEGLTLDRNLFGASFFILTGFHGAHVAVGVVWLLILMTEAWRHRLPASRALSVEIAGLYWHFVDVVWIVIFTLIYLIE
ncbi:MAG TPA: cytochrome c oxidase subunit 3 [Longimicrobiales bacterium]|nr:cytochrome c oxidase subunit 3 [Longimicrobiales bacterium]